MEEKCWQWICILCVTYWSIKAFDCLPHELLIAKLDAYGFDKSSLKLIHSYLSNRKQRVKINDRYSSWSEILFGVPQGSILGPLLFNIFICNMFYFLEDFDIAIYADHSAPYCAGKSAEFAVNNLEQSSAIFFEWLNNNYMKVNTGKRQFQVILELPPRLTIVTLNRNMSKYY